MHKTWKVRGDALVENCYFIWEKFSMPNETTCVVLGAWMPGVLRVEAPCGDPVPKVTASVGECVEYPNQSLVLVDFRGERFCDFLAQEVALSIEGVDEDIVVKLSDWPDTDVVY